MASMEKMLVLSFLGFLSVYLIQQMVFTASIMIDREKTSISSENFDSSNMVVILAAVNQR